MREPALERVTHEKFARAPWKGFHQQLPGLRDYRAPLLDAEPFADRHREISPCPRIGQHFAHAPREKCRKWKLAPHVGRHMRFGIVAQGNVSRSIPYAAKLEHLACKHKGVAGNELLDKIFLKLTEHASRCANWPSFRLQSHVEHRLFDDDPDV